MILPITNRYSNINFSAGEKENDEKKLPYTHDTVLKKRQIDQLVISRHDHCKVVGLVLRKAFRDHIRRIIVRVNVL